MTKDEPILAVKDVTLPVSHDAGAAVSGISFTLSAGEGLVVQVSGSDDFPLLVDALSGIFQPLEGEILFSSNHWNFLSPDAAARQRHAIGRSFSRHAWLSNLDLDENITLAERHHTRRPESEIRAEAVGWGRRFGWDALPAIRPAWADSTTLRIGDWVRALLGARRLLVIEPPAEEVSIELFQRLWAAVEERRASGVAALWLVDDEAWLKIIAPTASAKYTLRHHGWTRE